MRQNENFMPRGAIALAGLVVGVGMLVANPGTARADAADKVLRVGTSFSCSSLNPYATASASCLVALRLIYPSLVQAGENSAVTPDFAESWAHDDAGLVWTFKLKSDASWSDGKPLTAKDAAFTIDMILKFAESSTANRARAVSNVESVEALDDTTLVVRYKEPTSNVVGRLGQIVILPEHVWAPLQEGDGSAIKTFQNPLPVVSGGPFLINRFTPNQAMIFASNPDFYGEKPALKGLGFQFFTDSTAMVSALLHGQIDVLTPLPVTSVEAVKKAGLEVTNSPGIRFHNLLLNSSENQKDFPEIRDPKVREAFAHAVDRVKIAEVAYLGYATPGSSMVPKVTGEWSNPKVEPEAFDLDLASKLLDDAGYARGADGIRTANGHPMRYNVLIPTNVEGAEGLRALDIVTADFKKIGVDLVPQQGDNSTIGALITGPNNSYSQSTIAQWGWIPQMDPDFILSVVTCGQIGGLSETGYCNPAYDELYSAQSKEIDAEKRRAIVWEMQAVLQRDRPYIVTVQQNNIEARSKQWTGFVEDPLGLFNYGSRRTIMGVQPVE
jgi:peptide/nickel transport system substrate-binding protein